jgi:hypothetical protein
MSLLYLQVKWKKMYNPFIKTEFLSKKFECFQKQKRDKMLTMSALKSLSEMTTEWKKSEWKIFYDVYIGVYFIHHYSLGI